MLAQVLILIVVEERIGYYDKKNLKGLKVRCLNPYCSGRKNRICSHTLQVARAGGLNPYCSGRKNRIITECTLEVICECLNPYCSGRKNRIGKYTFI